MIKRALEVVERVESSFLWFWYLVSLVVFGTVVAFILFAAQSQGEEVSLSWDRYLNFMGVLAIPLGTTILIRVLHALNYIIFGGEPKE